jgi:predicted nuclease of predicted toxin-antitoxin system
MKFLVDECTGTTVATWLASQGYEVFRFLIVGEVQQMMNY